MLDLSFFGPASSAPGLLGPASSAPGLLGPASSPPGTQGRPNLAFGFGFEICFDDTKKGDYL